MKILRSFSKGKCLDANVDTFEVIQVCFRPSGVREGMTATKNRQSQFGRKNPPQTVLSRTQQVPVSFVLSPSLPLSHIPFGGANTPLNLPAANTTTRLVCVILQTQ